MILGENGEKMSKSRGNVVNPDEIVREYGADTLRTYEMFIGDFTNSASWTDQGVLGCRKFLDRVWKMEELLNDGQDFTPDLERTIHQTIKKVTEDFESLKFNTAIAQLMTLSNEIRKLGSMTRADWKVYLTLLNPVAPHITEELWERAGFEGHLATDGSWPRYDEDKLLGETIKMPVQVNGKLRGYIQMPVDADQDAVLDLAQKDEGVARHLLDKKLVKTIYIPKKILNFVVK